MRRLEPPWIRATLWLAISLPSVAAVIWAKLVMIDLAQALVDTRFMIGQAATFATALTAAIAAFFSVVPGYDRRLLLLPLVPLAVWLASVGSGTFAWCHDQSFGGTTAMEHGTSEKQTSKPVSQEDAF